MKLIKAERESEALRNWLGDHRDRISSTLGQIEARRAMLAARLPVEEADAVLLGINLLPIGDQVATAAGTLPPSTLRSLDAIHLASALSLGDDLDAFATYDARLAAAASGAGLQVATPV